MIYFSGNFIKIYNTHTNVFFFFYPLKMFLNCLYTFEKKTRFCFCFFAPFIIYKSMINVIYSTPRVEGHLLSMDTLNRNNRRFDELFAKEKKKCDHTLGYCCKKKMVKTLICLLVHHPNCHTYYLFQE